MPKHERDLQLLAVSVGHRLNNVESNTCDTKTDVRDLRKDVQRLAERQARSEVLTAEAHNLAKQQSQNLFYVLLAAVFLLGLTVITSFAVIMMMLLLRH